MDWTKVKVGVEQLLVQMGKSSTKGGKGVCNIMVKMIRPSKIMHDKLWMEGEEGKGERGGYITEDN